MTLTAAERLKNSWVCIFKRKGADGEYTRLFDNLTQSQRNGLLAEFKLSGSELPVIGSVQGSGNWLVLTTERLIWSFEGHRREVATNLIYDATVDFHLQCGSHGKLDISWLQISTTNGDVSIQLEPGAPLGGGWNILKNLNARNRRFREGAG